MGSFGGWLWIDWWANITDGCRPESMMRFLEIVRSEYGGVEGYMMNTLGFTKEEIDSIRSHVVTGELASV